MTLRTIIVRSTLEWALVVGVLMGIIGLFAFDGLHPVSAQADTTAPTVSSVAISSDPDDDALSGVFFTGVYGIGDSIQVTVRFSEDVAVTGGPRLALDIGGASKVAEYDSTDGSAVVFSYTVAEGDSDTDGIAVDANRLTLNGGSIKDAADNPASLAYDALTAQTAHKVDGIRPRMTRFAFLNGTDGDHGFYTAGEELSIDAPWSETIRFSNNLEPTISVDFGGTAKTCTLVGYYGFLHFICPIQSGDYDADGPTVTAGEIQVGNGWLRDTAGNPAILTHPGLAADSDFRVDAILPYVTAIEITSSPDSSDGYTAGETIEITVTFNETVTVPRISRSDIPGYPKPKIEFDVGGQARVATFDSTSANSVLFTYNVAAGDQDSDGVSIDANKLSLSGGAIWDQAKNTPLTPESDGILGLGVGAAVTHSSLDDDPSHKVSTDIVTAPTIGTSTIIGAAVDAEQLCRRTPEVKAAILEAIPGATAVCIDADPPIEATYETNVTASQLAGITNLDLTSRFPETPWIVAFQPGDFKGLTGLDTIIIVEQPFVAREGLADAGVPLSVLADAGVPLSVLAGLQTLYFSNSDLNRIESPDFFRGLTNLRQLVVTTNNMTYELPGNPNRPEGTAVGPLINPEAWRHLPNLRKLSIGSNRILTLPAGFFGHLANLEELDMFDMWYEYHPYGFGSQNLPGGIFEGLTHLRKLDLGHNAIGAAAVDHCLFNGLTTLEVLDLRENPLLETLPRSVLNLPQGVRILTDGGVAYPSQDDNHAAVGQPAISGTPSVGETLTASPNDISDADGMDGAVLAYQWSADDGSGPADIPGAAGSSLILTEDQEGQTISVTVSFTNDACNAETLTSEPTAAVKPKPNSLATGAPTISGTAQVGETLTAGISGIADADGLGGETFTYQWVSGDGTTDTDIEKATGSTYTLVAPDQGRFVKVRVTFTDDGGNEETLTSAPTEPVFGDGPPGAPRNLAATAGNKEVTLSWEPPADNGNAPATRYRIEWRVDGKDYDQNHWGTARSTTYTTNDQANLANGVKYVFRVKAENDDGNSYGPYGPASGEVSATPTSGSAVDLATPVLSDTETLHHGMVRLDWEDIEDAGWYVVQYYHVEDGEWLDLPAAGVDIAFHGSSAVVSNLHGLSWLRVGAMSCAGASEWSQIEQLFGTEESDWEDVPVPEVAEGDEIEPCPVVLGTPVLSDTEALHHGMVQLDWQDIEDAGWYVVQYYHLEGGEWLDLPAVGVEIAVHGSSAVVSNLHGLSWLRVGAVSCAGASEWSQIEQLFGTNASDWEGVPVPEVAEGDEIEPCPEEVATRDNSPATGAPTISGTVQVGETLMADTSGVADADGLENATFTYQWLADDSEITGATGLTYTLVAADEGKAIKVQVSFTDDTGSIESLTSAVTDAVSAEPTPNSPATGAPTISGTAQVGETLMADTSGIADADGLGSVQYEYRWLADDADISGATSATYTLVAADEGKAIRVRVSFTDDAGNGEALTSEATDAVAAAPTPNTPATGAPAISGTVQVGETLTADTSGIADADGLSNVQYEYQWLADAAEIAEATGSSYTLADTDEGKAITVRVSFTDDAGNDESLTSAATDAVAATEPSEPPDKPTGLSATATYNQVVLTWDDPDDDSITGYVILRRIRVNNQGGDFNVLVANTETAATTYTDDTVAASTTYTYRIKAINEHGTSERSRWVHIDTPAPPVPDQPTGLDATATHDSVTLTWDDPGDDSITGYVILRRLPGVDPEGQFDELVANTESAATTYTDDSVSAETRYTYRIKAINEHGTSERSRWYHIDTPAAPDPVG